MKDELRECVDLLTRIRDTYLKNHAAEREVMTKAIERGQAALGAEVVPQREFKPLQTEEKPKRRKK